VRRDTTDTAAGDLESMRCTKDSVPGALVGDRWFGIVRHRRSPVGAAYASLRGTARDIEGNASEVTIIHAYRLAVR